jgi:hypothetical protein
MPNWGALLKVVKYAPQLFDMLHLMRPPAPPSTPPAPTVLPALEEFKGQVAKRLESQEAELAQLRARQHALELQLDNVKLVVYIGGGVLALFLVIFVIAGLTR